MSEVHSGWEDLGDWWLDELDDDPAYAEEIEPLVLALLMPISGQTYLDVGCGEGRLAEAVRRAGSRVVGVDLLHDLLIKAKGERVRLLLPSLGTFREKTFSGAYVSLVLEHLQDESELFGEIARVLRLRAPLVLVMNHPVFTAPGSAPIQEPDEILWRPGGYLGRGFSDERVGHGTVRFYHRPMSAVLNAAAEAGFVLEHMTEIGVSDAQVQRTPVLDGQRHIPRVLGVRWSRSST